MPLHSPSSTIARLLPACLTPLLFLLIWLLGNLAAFQEFATEHDLRLVPPPAKAPAEGGQAASSATVEGGKAAGKQGPKAKAKTKAKATFVRLDACR